MTWLKPLETRTWRNAPVCILGAGPSLRLFDFTKVNDCHIFSVNSSILKTNWQSNPSDDILRVWISNDSLCKKWSYFEKVKKDLCFKIVRNSWIKYKEELEDFIFFNPRASKEDVIIETDDGLLYNSSVPSAIDLAIKLKFKQIYLFGIDHELTQGKSHFWQFLNIKDQPKECIIDKSRKIHLPPNRIMQPISMQENVWNMNISVFKAIEQYARKLGVEIVNVNDSDTRLPFRHEKLESTVLRNYGIIRM
jgi:hypothetical protein